MSTTQRLPASLTPLDVALAALLRDIGTLAPRWDARPDAPPSALAEVPELKAWPSHDVAAVDGWASRASDLVGASSFTPLPLSRSPVWVEAGDGIPDGCDCVLDEDSIDLMGPIAQALSEAIPGQGVRRKSGAIADASRIAGAWRPGDLRHAGLRLRVVNVPGGTVTAKLIASGLREAGIEIMLAEAATRDTASVAGPLDGGDCDLLITIGGSGVGRTDATVIALAERGEVIAHGLALQPGRTAAVGRIGRTPVIALPGAPDQALAVWWALVLPVLDRLSGRQTRPAVTRPLARKIASSVGIAEVVLLERQGDGWMPLSVGDLPFAMIARADAWLLVPGGSEGHAAGTPVNAYMLRE
ncbi:MAG TPA: molybdopterin-binding protein [Bradyrhizobium sp.]|nr:molybdopterin-binding protein [Bradyrhizobium sp.]